MVEDAKGPGPQFSFCQSSNLPCHPTKEEKMKKVYEKSLHFQEPTKQGTL